jgi:hypothetical protein
MMSSHVQLYLIWKTEENFPSLQKIITHKTTRCARSESP